MTVTIEDIEAYLVDVKASIRNGKYRVEQNSNRSDNMDLFIDYVIDKRKEKEILLSLTPMDFSEIRYNRKPGYEHELLYVFGKEVELLQRFGSRKEQVALYIKFNKLESKYVIVISFHKQKYPLKYAFR